MHWAKIDSGERGVEWNDFLSELDRTLYRGDLWRHNVSGDLPGRAGEIDRGELYRLVQVNAKRGARGFTYTHKPVFETQVEGESALANRVSILTANANGFTINLSADNRADADRKAALEIAPVVTIEPEAFPRMNKTPEGRPIVSCPAQYTKEGHYLVNEKTALTSEGETLKSEKGFLPATNCKRCGLCQKKDRKSIVAFVPHGTRKNALKLKVLNNGN